MIRLIFLKELTELFRDKKTLAFMILLPMLVFPVLFGSIAFFATKTVQQEQTRSLTYLVVNGDHIQGLQQLLQQQSDFIAFDSTESTQSKLENASDWEQLVRSGKVDFVLEVDTDFDQMMASSEQSIWNLHFNNAEVTSSVWPRVKRVIDSFNRQLRQQKLSALNVTIEQQAGLVQPIDLVQVDIAKAKESLGAKLGGMVSYILLPLCLMGAIYPAIDLGAGEKERGTLESLLIAPLSRSEIVLGKFFTIVSTSLFAAFMALASLFLWGFVFAQALAIEAIIDVVGTLGLLDIVLALFMLLPIILFFSALVLSISVYARSFKEAQNYMGPLSFLIFAPLIIAMLPGINLDWQWASVPVTNVALAVKDILKGQIDWAIFSFIWLYQLAFAVAMLVFCIFWFRQEKVLFR